MLHSVAGSWSFGYEVTARRNARLGESGYGFVSDRRQDAADTIYLTATT